MPEAPPQSEVPKLVKTEAPTYAGAVALNTLVSRRHNVFDRRQSDQLVPGQPDHRQQDRRALPQPTHVLTENIRIQDHLPRDYSHGPEAPIELPAPIAE